MTHKRKSVCSIVFILTVGMLSAETVVSRRIGLFVGANNGGPSRQMLRYAAQDAKAVSKVFGEMGGIGSGDMIVLIEPKRSELERAVKSAAGLADAGIRSSGRTEFIFYYSGHSDEEGLLLNREKMSYADLKAVLSSVPAEMRIVILDSCASGAFTRMKGGERVPSFLADASAPAGHAFIASSSVNESAQESDKVEGSFFTHHLVSGLRGGADANSDGRVSLNEAYQFAYQHTLAVTEHTVAGPQHPNYDMKISGSGDVVMTDLKQISAGLVLAAELSGRVAVRDSSGYLVAEVVKSAGKPLELGMEPGAYEVTVQTPNSTARASVDLNEGDRKVLLPSLLEGYLPPIQAVVRGDAVGSTNTASTPEERIPPAPDRGEYVTIPFKLSFVPDRIWTPGIITVPSMMPGRDGLDVRSPRTYKTISHGLVGLIGADTDILHGFAWSGVMNLIYERMYGVAWAGVFNIVEEDSAGVLWAGVFNLNNGRAGLVRWAGVLNFANKDAYGVDWSGAISYVKGSFRGVVFSGGANFTKDLNGVAASGGASLCSNLAGVQTAGGLTIASGEVLGVQVAGGAAVAAGKFRGLQTAGGVNIAGNDLTGAQIATVNVCGGSVRGAQIGVVNIAKSSVFSLGLVNIIGDGLLHPSVFVDQALFSTAGFRSGTKHFYTTMHWGVRDDFDTFVSRLGLGLEVPVGKRLFFDGEVLSGSVQKISEIRKTIDSGFSKDYPGRMTVDLRVLAGWKFFRHLGIFAGASLTWGTPVGVVREFTSVKSAVWALSSDTALAPGFFAGVQF